MEIITITVKEFLNGDADHLWTLQHLDAHKISLELGKTYTADSLLTVRNGLFTLPNGDFFSLFYERAYGILQELETPNRPFLIGDYNGSFMPNYTIPDSPNLVPALIPYTETYPDFIYTISKKRRARFKSSLRQEVPVVIEEVDIEDDSWLPVMRQKQAFYKQENCQFYPEMLRATKPKARAFKAVKLDGIDRETVAVCVLVETFPNNVYAFMFASIEPCVRQFHLALVEKFLRPGTNLHYGSSFSFKQDISGVYGYKNHLANRESKCLFFAILEADSDKFRKPYYSLSDKKWL